MEIEDFLKSKGLFYTRDLINIMDETINLPKIMEEYAKLYHESELKKLRVGDVSSRRELLIAFMESLTTEDLTQIEIAEFENVADKFLGN